MNLRGKIRLVQASLTSGTTYYLFVIAAPAQQRIAIEAFGIFGNANAANTPGLLQFCSATSAGTSPTSTLTPHPLEPECTETFQATYTYNPTGAPSAITVIDDRSVNPQLGITEYLPQGQEYFVKGGGFFVVQFVPQWTGNYNGWLQINE
jgi:hypothetical protein